MTFAIGLIIGLLFGGLAGIMIISMMVVSSRSSEREERLSQGSEVMLAAK